MGLCGNLTDKTGNFFACAYAYSLVSSLFFENKFIIMMTLPVYILIAVKWCMFVCKLQLIDLTGKITQ